MPASSGENNPQGLWLMRLYPTLGACSPLIFAERVIPSLLVFGSSFGAFEHSSEDGKGPQPYMINLFDFPGHVDFSSAALRIIGGAIVIADCIEGCAAQTVIILHLAT